MSQLGITGNDIADGVNARLPGLHPLVHMNIAAFGLDLGGLLQAYLLCIWPASNGDEYLFRLKFLQLLALWREAYGHAGLPLFHLVDFGVNEAVDAFFLEATQQFLADLLVFHGNETREHLDDRYFGPERAIQRCKLDSHRPGADDDHGLWD